MSAWTDAFLEVSYRAKVFAMSWDEANYSGCWRNANARTELARAKAKLELEMATYRVESKRGLKR